MDRRQTDTQTTYRDITVLCVASRGKTRKLSYRKDDRAMRPVYGCLKNFENREYAHARLLLPKCLMAFVAIDPVNRQTKFKVRIFTHS